MSKPLHEVYPAKIANHLLREYKKRINKAIEYIEKHKWCETSEYNDDYKEIVVRVNKLLDILKGVDKE